MVRIVGDENLSDDERITAIGEATGAREAKAENLLTQSRGGPRSDRLVLDESQLLLTSVTGVAVISATGGRIVVAESTPTREAELIQG
jgi:hypothetical protein